MLVAVCAALQRAHEYLEPKLIPYGQAVQSNERLDLGHLNVSSQTRLELFLPLMYSGCTPALPVPPSSCVTVIAILLLKNCIQKHAKRVSKSMTLLQLSIFNTQVCVRVIGEGLAWHPRSSGGKLFLEHILNLRHWGCCEVNIA
jgi:hypothetical protein